ncbi:hypothetical protein TCAL_02953 [Tigriopus californicus]|uniref:Uncharacterized protein n=1 Tax=Tigriopus californicus TaxID=6832 RepID=A0A553NNY4_TIGCA|nr:protein CWC15 homolog [Tigriopus californicus]TRY67149.1 hypothetical protein TCAL_02953 [Tigriopus californicus]|eukprot:TCALIF_02953-PA protein Name:"Similar to cwc15-a Protein CWC15 homolog A (Xenopus laevis)" AED:0.06 eAED:0.06 QI:186/1/1/1/1/1/4/111/229
MTTAARPTFNTARGGSGARERDLSAMTKQYSSRDMPSHTSLKHRDRGQSSTDDLSGRDFRRELEDRERLAKREGREGREDRTRSAPKALEASSSGSKKPRLDPQNIDADDPLEDSDSDDSDSDDDTALLMAELNKIRQEKAEEQQEQEEERRVEDEQIRMENILTGNPLLKERYTDSTGKSDLRVKRRWDDDVVFKNCSRAEPDKQEKNFINDAIRSTFHRKFMDKYIK